jgi:hypothetical protein
VIEIIRLNNNPVRVTGFRQFGTSQKPVFDVVIQIPGESANRDFVPMLAGPLLTLTILHPDGQEETHEVTITAHHLHTAGPPHALLFRHQLRLELSADVQIPLGPIGEELAELLTRFHRLLDALDAAGIVSCAAVKERAEELGGKGRNGRSQ